MRVLLFILITLSASAQPSPDNLVSLFAHTRVVASSCTPGTNTLAINSLYALGNTSNSSSSIYLTLPFTPSSNATLIAFLASQPDTATDSAVTNTGATPLTWWKAARTNYASTGTPTMYHSAWVTQLAQGVTPFSMQVAFVVSAGSGWNIVIAEVTGADQTAAWGSNAIVQTVARGSNTIAGMAVPITAPGNNGFNALIGAFADSGNNNNDNTAGGGSTELTEVAFNTTAQGLAVEYILGASGQTFMTNSAGSRSWGPIVMEVKAGTNCNTGQSITDNFTRADGGDIGASWTPITSETGMQILSNQVQPQSVGSDCGERYSGVSWSANQSAEVKVTVTGGTAGTGGGVVVRCASGARTYYRLVIDASGHWEVGWNNAGSFTPLNSGTTTYSAGAVLKLSIVGSTLVSTYNGVQLDSRTDNNILTGSPGISYSSSTTTCILDDWTGIDGL